MTVRLRRIWTGGIAALAAIALASCSTSAPDSAPTSAPSGPVDIVTVTETVTTSPASTSTQPAEPMQGTPPQWPSFASADASAISQLDTRTVNDFDRKIHIVVPQLTGHDAFNRYLSAWQDDLADTFIDDYYPDGIEGYGDSAARPWLASTWSATAVSSDIIGIHLATEFSPGASTAAQRTIVWYDPVAGKILDATDLLTEDAWADLPDLVAAELEQQLLPSGAALFVDEFRTVFQGAGPAVGFGSDGSLLLGFDAYQVAAGFVGAPTVVLDDPEGRGLLTDRGVAALRASVSPTAGAVPDRPEIPDPADVDCSVESCVALTFDDGPSGATTPELLEILADAQVSATFFMLGSQVTAFPQVVADVAAAGHEIANHTWSHPSLTDLSAAKIRAEISDTNDAIAEVTGRAPTLLRPPYGATNDRVAAAAAAEGMAQILWNIDTRDWDHHDPAQTVAAASEAAPGAIILMHDIHATTIEAVADVIDTVRANGLTPVTVSQLLGSTTPGEKYFQR